MKNEEEEGRIWDGETRRLCERSEQSERSE